jgi:hypothetical protein
MQLISTIPREIVSKVSVSLQYCPHNPAVPACRPAHLQLKYDTIEKQTAQRFSGGGRDGFHERIFEDEERFLRADPVFVRFVLSISPGRRFCARL